MTIIIPIGLSGSGKTTYYYEHCQNTYNLISPDCIREELYGDAACQDNPKKVFDIAYKRLERRIALNQNVYFDATNLKHRDRQRLIEYIRKFEKLYDAECRIVYLIFLEDAETCIARDAGRERTVGKSVIMRQLQSYQNPVDNDEDYDSCEFVIPYKV